MVATRDWRHAQTCGLTYCTVLMPAAFNATAAGLLKSCASMPMNASIPPCSMREINSRRSFKIRRKCGRTSKKPMTAISSERYHASQPAAIIFGPAMPTNLESGASLRSSSMRPAPSVSPDASPATSANLSERFIGPHRAVFRRLSGGPSRAHARRRPCGPIRAHARRRPWCRSTREAARAVAQGIQEEFDLGLGRYERRQLGDGFVELEVLAVDDAISPADVAELVRREAAPLEAFGVDATRLGRPARDRDVRGHVLRHIAEHARQRVRADAAKLVDRREAAEDRVVADADVARYRGVVREDRVVAHDTVVRDVTVGHDPVVAADRRHAGILDRAAIQRAVLADRVAVADDELRALAVVLLVLRIVADRGELEDVVVDADDGRTFDDGMRLDASAAADLDVGSDDRVRADVDARVDLRGRIDDGSRIDQDLGPSAMRICASATALPSTSATPVKRQRFLRRFTSSTRSVS